MDSTLIFSVFVHKCFKVPLFSHWLFNVLDKKNVGKIKKTLKKSFYKKNKNNAYKRLLQLWPDPAGFHRRSAVWSFQPRCPPAAPPELWSAAVGRRRRRTRHRRSVPRRTDTISTATGQLPVALFVLERRRHVANTTCRCNEISHTTLRYRYHESGTIYRLKWRLLSRCLHSASGWKPSLHKIIFRLPPGR